MTNCLPDSNKKSECFVSRQLTKHSLYIIMYRTCLLNDLLAVNDVETLAEL